MRRSLRLQYPQSLESAAVEATIAGQQGVGLNECMRADKQVRNDSKPRRPRLLTEFTPKSSGLRRCILGNRFESDAEEVQGFGKRRIGLEMCPNLSPDDLARDECASVVRNSQCFARSFSMDWVGSQNIQKDG